MCSMYCACNCGGVVMNKCDSNKWLRSSIDF